MPNNPYYTLGLDLGKSADPTALAIVESDPFTGVLRLVGLHRFPLGTPYTEILQVLEQRLNSAPLAGRVRLAVDATGIGAPFVDQFRQQLPATETYAITITPATRSAVTAATPTSPSRTSSPPPPSSSNTAASASQPRCAKPRTLIDELLSYQYTRNEHGYNTYGASAGQHDDLVIALSLALWLTTKHRIPNPNQRSSCGRPQRHPRHRRDG